MPTVTTVTTIQKVGTMPRRQPITELFDKEPSERKPLFMREGREPNADEKALINFVAFLNHPQMIVAVGNGIGSLILSIPARDIHHAENWGMFSGERIEQDYS